MTLQEILNSDLDLGSIGAALRQGFRWWIDELAALLPAGWREGLSTRSRLFAERQASGRWRFWHGGHAIPGEVAPRSARGVVGVLLPAQDVLVRRIEVPRMPAADVRRMLALDIDRLSPLSPDLIHFDSEVLDRDAAGGKQSLLLGIVTRAAASRSLQEARAAGLSPSSLAVRLEADRAPQRFDFLPAVLAAAGERGSRSARPYWWAAVGAFFLANVGLLVGRDMADVARLRGLVDGERPAATAAMRLRRQVEGEETRRAIMIRRGSNLEPLRILDAVTEATPRGAWVQRLEFNGQALHVVGFRAGDIDMAAAIRGSGLFANPRSLASDTAPGMAGGEPFDITADVRPRARP